MIDPELEEDVREALLAERERPPVLNDEGKRRVLARLAISMAGIAGASAATLAGASIAKGAAATAGTSLARASLAKIVFIAAIAFVAGGGTHAAYMEYASARSPTPTKATSGPLVTSVASPSSTAPVAPSSIVPVVDVASMPIVIRTADASASKGAEPTALDGPALRLRERSLLESAQTALAHGDAADALSTVTRHAVEFPKSVLAEERDALRIRALAKLGRCDDVRSSTESFIVVFPRSLQRSAIERLCVP